MLKQYAPWQLWNVKFTHLPCSESTQHASGLEFQLSTLFPTKTGYSFDKLLDLGRFSTYRHTHANTSQALIIAHTSTYTHTIPQTHTELMKQENWQHIKSQHVTSECLADFFLSQPLSKQASWVNSENTFYLKQQGRGVVETLFKTMSMP